MRDWLDGDTHYEVLGLDEKADEQALQARVASLQATLDHWATATEATLQQIGQAGKRRLHQLKQDLANRDAYNRELESERRRRAVSELARTFWDWDIDVNDSKVLSTQAYDRLRNRATANGLGPEEIEQVIAELKLRGAKTGINIAGREVHSLQELADACAGEGEKLVEVFKNGELEAWLRLAAKDTAKADKVQALKNSFKFDHAFGAQLWLWDATGDTRLVLAAGRERLEVKNVGQWIEALYSTDEERRPAAVEATKRMLRNGVLKEWLMLVADDPDHRLSESARNYRWKDEDVALWQLVWLAEDQCLTADALRGVAEAAYRQTMRLMRLNNFPELHYRHAVYCALTGKGDEMEKHLRLAVEAKPELAGRAVKDSHFTDDAIRPRVEAVVSEKLPKEGPPPVPPPPPPPRAPAGYPLYLKLGVLLALAGLFTLTAKQCMMPPPAPTEKWGLARSLTAHQGGVNALSFSADNKMLASAGKRRWVTLQTLQGEVKQTLKLNGVEARRAVAFDPESRFLATSSRELRLLTLWKLKDNLIRYSEIPTAAQYGSKCVELISPPKEPACGEEEKPQFRMRMDAAANAVIFSPKGDMVAGVAENGQVKLWAVPEAKEFSLPDEELRAPVAFSEEGQLLATAGRDAQRQDRQVLLWDLARRKLLAKFSIAGAKVGALAFSPDGKFLVSGFDGSSIALWDVKDIQTKIQLEESPAPSRTLLISITPDSPPLFAVAFSRDGRYLAGVAEGTPVGRLWDLRAAEGGRPLLMLTHESPISALTFSHDGRMLATGSDDGVVKLWVPEIR